jgi:uncharacterized membrane protein
MFNHISKTLITGFFALLPIILTIYLLYWMAVSSEQVLGGLLKLILADRFYFPGMGMIAGLFVLFSVGLMLKTIAIRRLFALGERIIYRLPIIKTVYRAIHDLFDFFSPGNDEYGQVVKVDFNGLQAIGFITQEDPKRIPPPVQKEGCELVYIPMSYMIGGYTLIIPRENIERCDMAVEEAMRFVLTAGIAGK